jgi:hypothetical protein
MPWRAQQWPSGRPASLATSITMRDTESRRPSGRGVGCALIAWCRLRAETQDGRCPTDWLPRSRTTSKVILTCGRAPPCYCLALLDGRVGVARPALRSTKGTAGGRRTETWGRDPAVVRRRRAVAIGRPIFFGRLRKAFRAASSSRVLTCGRVANSFFSLVNMIWLCYMAHGYIYVMCNSHCQRLINYDITPSFRAQKRVIWGTEKACSEPPVTNFGKDPVSCVMFLFMPCSTLRLLGSWAN